MVRPAWELVLRCLKVSTLPTFIFCFSHPPRWLRQLSLLQGRRSQHLGEKPPKIPKDIFKSISAGSVPSFRAMLLRYVDRGISQLPQPCDIPLLHSTRTASSLMPTASPVRIWTLAGAASHRKTLQGSQPLSLAHA